MKNILETLKKKILSLVLALMMTLGSYAPAKIEIASAPEKSERSVRILSQNLRCNNDLYGFVKNRALFVSEMLKNYEPDSFGVQEATETWLSLLDESLGEKYARVGEPRDNAKNTEYSAVYYRTDKFELLDEGTIWLSKTPEKFGSKSFLASMPRICTWATLKNKETGFVYTHVNTHLDFLVEYTRSKQSEVLLSKIGELQKVGPLVCTGDFNADERDETYEKMTAALDDSRLLAKETESGKTFHNYGRGDLFHKTAIDFIFVSKGTEVERYKIIKDTVDGMYLSDHYGIMADIIF
ncbi:MAG: endonuclease/exonuclease/phosphatase family protein [Clostridia bacterium]|nr:endonuclease/exonuclease/phosphatase family protein [Clostridia bacterium]